MAELDLPDDCWTTPIGSLQIGDVCHAMPLAVLYEDRIDRLAGPDDDGGDFFVPVRHSYGLVIGLIDDYAVIAAIGTLAGVGDEETFSVLIERGRGARTHIRLPLIPDDPLGAWDGRDGIALLSQIETFAIGYGLLERRVAAMSESARQILRQRIARLVEA